MIFSIDKALSNGRTFEFITKLCSRVTARSWSISNYPPASDTLSNTDRQIFTAYEFEAYGLIHKKDRRRFKAAVLSSRTAALEADADVSRNLDEFRIRAKDEFRRIGREHRERLERSFKAKSQEAEVKG